ncbi:thiol reductant ABC exporter subunit CydC [Cellulomonas marina]|uniref:thiol reductant ABC exporter subunit CydC n=1 Tax=Cellulomonas marina TaxID=988821 RepID=UPI001587F38B|nr:thiol reductant ABC exporter subunit CydC [Cellulomonas marina]
MLRHLPRGRTALAVALATGTVLSGAALLATSGALVTNASLRPESLLVLLPLITSVRAFGLSRAALRYVERLVSHDVTLRLVARLRTDLLLGLVPLSPAALTGVRGGELLARLHADDDALQDVLLRLLAPAAVAVLAGSAAVVLAAAVHPGLGAVPAALLLLLGVVVPAWADRAGAPAARAVAAAEEARGADVLDLVRGLADHVGGDGGATALAAADARLREQEAAERAAARVAAVATLLREGVPALGLVAAFVLVGGGVAAGETSPLLLAAAALGVLGSFEAVAGLGAAWPLAGGARAAGRRVEALAATPPAVVDPEGPGPRPAGHDVAPVDVGVTYPGASSPALAHLDLVVRAGEKVALVGPSGAGKSTVLALLLRARDPSAGRVLLGGADLRRLPLDEVRAASAWVPQEPQVPGASLAGNLRMGDPAADDGRLRAVLADVGLADRAADLGLDGWVGEAGSRLSAGERARLGLARALLRPAPLLLVDEPTAHLDRAAGAAVVSMLAREPRTVVMVTHDATLLDERWRVVVLRPPGTPPGIP